MDDSQERIVNWPIVASGVLLVVFAAIVFFAPVFFLELITVIAGIGFLVSAVTGFIAYWKLRCFEGGVGVLLMSVSDFIIAALLLLHPMMSAAVISGFLGIVFVVFGICEIAGTSPIGKLLPETRAVLIVAGILTVVVGIMFVIWPSSLSIWVAAFALIRGITLIISGANAHVQ